MKEEETFKTFSKASSDASVGNMLSRVLRLDDISAAGLEEESECQACEDRSLCNLWSPDLWSPDTMCARASVLVCVCVCE